MSIQPEGNSCSDPGRVLVLNDPPVGCMAMEAGDASGIGVMDLAERRFNPAFCEAVDPRFMSMVGRCTLQPIQTRVQSAWFLLSNLLKPKYDEPLSTYAFKFNVSTLCSRICWRLMPRWVP